MRGLANIGRMEMAGSYRRGCETVGDLDLLVEASRRSAEVDRVMDWFGLFAPIQETMVRGDTKMSVRLDCGLQVDLRVVPSASFGAAWQYFTGSQAHNVELRGRARKRGLKVNEWGVFRRSGPTGESPARAVEDRREANPSSEALAAPVAGRTEADIYRALGLPWIPPELREARDEFDWAEAVGAEANGAGTGVMPKLIALADLWPYNMPYRTDLCKFRAVREMVRSISFPVTLQSGRRNKKE